MGASLVYLESPNKNVEIEKGGNDKIEFVTASMQGWRINMEDSHVAVQDYCQENNLALFGVFDGHGGKEVAHFTKNHLGELLRSTENFK